MVTRAPYWNDCGHCSGLKSHMIMFHFVNVLGGVYLRTATGEQIGRLDQSGSPFETLDEAREHAVWLEKMLDLQQSKNRHDREITGVHDDPPGSELERLADGNAQAFHTRENSSAPSRITPSADRR